MTILQEGGITLIEEKEDAPLMLMDKNSLTIKIKGPSFPEDAIDTYQPVIDWLNDVGDNFDTELTCEFDYSILSSASNKAVFEILLKLERLTKAGKKILVKWYYEGFDEDMFDEGRGFKEIMSMPFEIIEK